MSRRDVSGARLLVLLLLIQNPVSSRIRIAEGSYASITNIPIYGKLPMKGLHFLEKSCLSSASWHSFCIPRVEGDDDWVEVGPDPLPQEVTMREHCHGPPSLAKLNDGTDGGAM